VGENGPKSSVLCSVGSGQIFFVVFLETKFDWFFTLVSWKNGRMAQWRAGGAAWAAFFVPSHVAPFN
jgi:hypothetical protein